MDIAGRGYPWPAVLMWLPAMLVNICGFIFLIPRFGVTGAAISVSVSFAVIFILILAYYVRLTGTKLRELFLVQSEDIKTITTITAAAIGHRPFSTKVRITDAVATVSDQNKVKA